MQQNQVAKPPPQNTWTLWVLPTTLSTLLYWHHSCGIHLPLPLQIAAVTLGAWLTLTQHTKKRSLKPQHQDTCNPA